MNMRSVWSSLAASAIVLVAGTAFSGGGVVNELVDFNQATGELSAYPAGSQSVATYLHRPSTIHLPSIGSFTPPDPCTGLADAWNITVVFDERHNTTSTFVFEALLTIMSDFQCHATVSTTTGSGTLPDIVTIAPTTP
jgi:hypothetical protein